MDGYQVYSSIRKQLLKLGDTEFENFIPYTIYKKKMAIAYGNCHMECIKMYLELNNDFNEKYGFYPLPPIYDMGNCLEMLICIGRCALFLHQSIRKENSYGEECASEYFLNKLRDDCIRISIPNLYGLPKCFFPQLKRREEPRILNYDLLAYTEVNIKKWIKENKTVKEIQNYIENGGIYPYTYIEDLWKEFCTKLEEREKEWNVKISVSLPRRKIVYR